MECVKSIGVDIAMSKSLERHLEAYRNFVFAVAERLAAKPPKSQLQPNEMTLLDYYRSIDINTPSENRKSINDIIKLIEGRMERRVQLLNEEIISEEDYMEKNNTLLQEKEYLEQQYKDHEFLPRELISRFAAELTYNFELLWELRLLGIFEWKDYICSLIKDVPMSCKIGEIEYEHIDDRLS